MSSEYLYRNIGQHGIYNITHMGEDLNAATWHSGVRPSDEGAPNQDSEIALAILRHLHTFFIPLLIVLGLIGNGLSFVTFLFTRLRVRASSFYLGTLALSDFGYLFIMAFVWLDKQGIRVLNQRGMCQIILFLSSTFSFWSVWLTVTFTAERCLAVQCPLWRLQLSTRNRARITIVATSVASLLLNSYLLVLTDVVVLDNGKSECEPRPEFEHILHYTNIMDTVITLVVPFVLIVIMNFMIGRALYLFNSRRRLRRINSSQLMSNDVAKDEPCPHCTGGSSLSNSNPCNRDSKMPTSDTGSVCSHNRPPPPPPPAAEILHPSQLNVFRMLFLVCTVFIILNLPSYVVRVHVFVLSVSDIQVPEHIFLLQRYFMLLYYTNFAVNIVLYNVSSRVFRRVMKQYVWTKWQIISGMCRSPSDSGSSDLGSIKDSKLARNNAI
ncbi:uncharacterized protein LOC135399828 [Ornithodoros turicata]|uniref:uncharacterized protein LOC135399828 n=1 Tax=Ornithodoros turicata TaxID=34597 RepID=UPI00313898BF